ncbi:MAG TPA: hypothetical protein VGJ29_15435 [Vicinamibacterales bacterium]
MRSIAHSICRSLALSIALLVAALAVHAQQPPTPDTPAAMRWRYIGPVGNRVASVSGVPGDPNVYYAGAASGGLWKTTDGGVYWESIFDGQSSQSIGAGQGQNTTRWPAELVSKLTYLAGSVDGSGEPPPPQARAVQTDYKKQWKKT